MEVKLFQKKYFALITSAVYAMIVVMFYKLEWKESYSFDSSCFFDKPCVRFCCKNEQLCNQNYIDENFNVSIMPEDEFTGWNSSQGVNAHFGKPHCSLKLVERIKTWEFLSDGVIDYGDESYDKDAYCFQEDTDSSKSDWKLFVCQSQEEFHKVFSISILLLIASIVVLVTVRDYRANVYGKNMLCLLTSVLITYIVLPFSYHGWIEEIQGHSDIVLLFGIFSSLLWTTVLTFDVWWTFRYFESFPDRSKFFKFYCFYAFGFAVSFAVILANSNRYILFTLKTKLLSYLCLSLFSIGVADLIVIVVTFIKVFESLKDENFQNNERFQAEKEKFWICLELHAILLITFFLEITSFESFDESFIAFIIADITKCVSALVIFAIVVIRKDMKSFLIRKHDSLHESFVNGEV